MILRTIFRFFLFTFPVLPFVKSGIAQSNSSLYLELGGSGGLASVNYEKHIIIDQPWQLSWSAGFSIAPIDKNNGTNLVFPLLLHGYYGKGQNWLEMGVGQGISITTRGAFFPVTLVTLGYKRNWAERPFYFRLTYTPLISYLIDFQYRHWAGMSLGYRFSNNSCK
jgi:hypothetical protein